jgi:hypothetical protein
MMPLCWIHRRGVSVLIRFALLLIFLGFGAAGQAQSPSEMRASFSPSPPAVGKMQIDSVVIGFLGGFVARNDARHTTVQIAQHLRTEYNGNVRVATFENRNLTEAHQMVLDLLHEQYATSSVARPTRELNVVLYGHSWGASAVVALARLLDKDKIQVALTLQVDSVAKPFQNDSVIPSNVVHAANFYQSDGFPRGQSTILAADPARTKILGNFQFDYRGNIVDIGNLPWYNRVFMKRHIQIECDPVVWQRVEELIREELPQSAAQTTR